MKAWKKNYPAAFAFFLLLMGFGSSHSQELVMGTVFDGETKNPVRNAYVRMGERNTKTDANGNFSLPFIEDEDLQAGGRDFHEFRIAPRDLKKDKPLNIYLTPKPEIQGLQSSGEAQSVYAPDFEYIFDYNFIDNNIVIATYFDKKMNKKKRNPGYRNCVLSLFENGVSKQRLIIPDFPYRLRRSPFGDLYLEGADYAYRVHYDSGEISLREVKYEDYLQEILPLTAAFDSAAYWVKIVPELPQVVHRMFSTELARALTVRVIRNRNYFLRVNDDYLMLDPARREEAAKLAKKYGFADQLFAPYLRRREFVIDLAPPYAPGYRTGDEYVIFDAMNQWIYRHTAQGGPIDSVYFDVGLDGEELVKIVHDPATQACYAIHEKSGTYYLRRIDHTRGSLGAPFKLTIPFPEKLKVYNGTLFYIHRDVDDGTRHLYSEKLDF
jgi:hypothetical protein